MRRAGTFTLPHTIFSSKRAERGQLSGSPGLIRKGEERRFGMSYEIRHVAVIGAGVMGGGIAAHTANAGIPCTLLDIVPNKLTPNEEAKGLTLESPQVRNRIVNDGFQFVLKSRPPALFSRRRADLIRLGNLEDNLDMIHDADMVIEVVVENLAVKQALFEKIIPYIKDTAIVTTNTSGIPIKDIAAKFGPDLRRRFLGTHFFNPPRWLKLLELIPTDETDPAITDFVSQFAENIWGKGVVICKDSPNFIANRVAGFDIMFILDYALKNGYTVEEVDAITGPLIGRPRTATFKLNDLAGLDTNYHVVTNLYPALPDDEDREVLRSERVLALMKTMVDKGQLGRKSKKGFYKMKKGPGGKKEFEVIDLDTGEYRPQQEVDIPSLAKAKDIRSLPERLRYLVRVEDKAGRLVWAIISYNLSYASRRIPEIADEIISIDRAMKWGYGHEMGPFEIWDALGVVETLERLEAEGMKVAPWVNDMIDRHITRFYREEADVQYYYDMSLGDYKKVSVSPRIIILKSLKDRKKTVRENESASLLDMGDDVACLEFHSKQNALDDKIVEMIEASIPEVERNFKGLVVGNQGKRFSVGANIYNILLASREKKWDQIDEAMNAMHKALGSFRRCARPVIAAPFDMALGGGAEVCMAADGICAAGDLFMGLVEVGVGLIPGGGGCKELVRRVVSPVVARAPETDPLPLLLHIFQMVAQAKITSSALEAKEWGFLDASDHIVMNRDHLLYDAKQMVLNRYHMGYVPPVSEKIYAVGKRGFEALHATVLGMRKAGFISDHDVTVATHLARVFSGGQAFSPRWVNEQHFLDLEKEAFISLCGEPKTQARIEHMLKTNKPLRN